MVSSITYMTRRDVIDDVKNELSFKADLQGYIEKEVKQMLECRNPNYLRVIGKEVRFITRDEFIESQDNDRRKHYEVRCGKCLSCKLYKSYQQANRLMLEAIHNEWTWFTTLTYDEEHYDEASIMLDPLINS